MKSFVAILAFSLLAGCASSDPWTRQDTVLQSIYTGTLVVDAIQTSQIQYDPGLQENGMVARSVLGRQPSTSDTWQYFATLAVSNYLISRALPSNWRPVWQGANIIHHTSVIFHNCTQGLGRICKED